MIKALLSQLCDDLVADSLADNINHVIPERRLWLMKIIDSKYKYLLRVLTDNALTKCL